MSSEAVKNEEEMQNRPESPPLGLLDPSRIQNPLAADPNHQMSMPLQHPSGFVMPEQPRPPPQAWQRTPTMSPANLFPGGSGTPGSSQRSSTGTPGQPPQPLGTPQQQQQQQFFHESPAHSQGAPMTPQSAGIPPGMPGMPPGTPQQQQQQPPPPPPPPQAYDYQAAQMQQQAMAQAQFESAYRQPHPAQMMAMPQYPPGYPPAQWQQHQMYARQAAAQRVVQRVPVAYPPGAYPAGMAPGPMTPVYPPQPSPATRSTPGSGGPPSGPPGTPQRPQYPPGANQFGYPPQQMTPTGGPPPGYPGTPAFSSPMFRPGPPPQALRPQYISPQSGPNQQTPGTPIRFAGQPLVGHPTPSPHFAPAPGAPQMVAAPDMRSPTLMSPTVPPPSAQHTPGMPRPMHNEMAMRPMAIPPQQVVPPQVTPQQGPPPQYRAPLPMMQQQQPPQQQPPPPPQPSQMAPQLVHPDPNTFPMAPITTDPELFLAGMSIHVFDVEKLGEDRFDRDNLEFLVRFHGGEIEFDAAKFQKTPNAQVTHVLIDSCRNPMARVSLERRHRIVSMQWIADVMERGRAEIPWKIAHLPGPFSDGFRPHLGRLFSLSGFDEFERETIAFMAHAMGARITPFLARTNDLLIAKGPSEKVSKAFEWSIPVVTYKWIADEYVCGRPDRRERPNVANPDYQLGSGHACDVIVPPSWIEKASPEFEAMMCCWKNAIIIREDAYEKAQEQRKAIQSDPFHFPGIRIAGQCAPPTDDEIRANRQKLDEADKKWSDYAKSQREKLEAEVKKGRMSADCGHGVAAENPPKRPQPRPRIYYGAGLDERDVTLLARKADFLGASTVDEIRAATHVVLMSGRRSEPLLEAILRGKNVVTPEWIVDSYTYKMWSDTLNYFLSDKKCEKELAYNCQLSVLRARNKQVFEGIQFHVTRFVEPSQARIVELIELGGGIVHAEKPEPRYLARCVETETPYIIISCEADSRFLSYLADSKLPVYNVDLILFAILRQKIEPLPQYRITIPIVMKLPTAHQN